MTAKFLITSYSRSGGVDVMYKRRVRRVGWWTSRITKQDNDRSGVCVVITIWPQDRAFSEKFLASLKKINRGLEATDFTAALSKLLQQEYQIEFETSLDMAETLLASIMVRLCKIKDFSLLAAALEQRALTSQN